MGGLLVDEFELRYADYSLSSDQEAVRDAFAEFFRNECPSERVRAAEPLGYDEKLWRQLADMGAASMGLPEQVGGAVARGVVALDGDALVLVETDEPPSPVANQGSTPL